MRCDEIQERFVDLLYDEKGTPPASPELRAHIASCPNCRQELEGLRATRLALGQWKDEPVSVPVNVPLRTVPARRWWPRISLCLRAGAIAALVIIAVLAVSNAEVTWNSAGFSFRTHLLRSRALSDSDYYTKTEMRELLKTVLDDTENRVMETNYLMMQRMMDTIEEDRWQELRTVRAQIDRNHNKN